METGNYDSIRSCGRGCSGPVRPPSEAPHQQETVQINGAGATFPYPIYSKWFAEYNKLHPNVEINYQSIGSGGGIRQLIERRPCSSAPPTVR